MGECGTHGREGELIQGYVIETTRDLVEELSACGINVLLTRRRNRMTGVG
jgi:hypothetical protein